MTQMERVARALARCYGLKGNPVRPRWKSHKLASPEEFAELVWRQFTDDALAAIAAVEDPPK